jgi:hypothetical protein
MTCAFKTSPHPGYSYDAARIKLLGLDMNFAARDTSSALRCADIAVYELPMSGIGHDFSEAEMQRIRRWLAEGEQK